MSAKKEPINHTDQENPFVDGSGNKEEILQTKIDTLKN